MCVCMYTPTCKHGRLCTIAVAYILNSTHAFAHGEVKWHAIVKTQLLLFCYARRCERHDGDMSEASCLFVCIHSCPALGLRRKAVFSFFPLFNVMRHLRQIQSKGRMKPL